MGLSEVHSCPYADRSKRKKKTTGSGSKRLHTQIGEKPELLLHLGMCTMCRRFVYLTQAR